MPKPVGYPLSLHIVSPSAVSYPNRDQLVQPAYPWLAPSIGLGAPNSWQVTLAELKDSTNQLVGTYFLDYYTDPNNALPVNVVFLIPKNPLMRGATYTAQVVGIDITGIAFNYIWSFTTSP
jgi:hypothetical protein